MTINNENLRIKDFLFFNALNRRTYEKMNKNQTIVFLRISLLITGIIAAFRGFFLSAFREIVSNPGEYYGSYPNRLFTQNSLTLNVLKGIEYGILEIVFLLCLLVIYKNINRDTANRNSSIYFDIALLTQLSMIKDCFFIIFSYFFSLQTVPIFNYSWYVTDYYNIAINAYDIGLFLPYILLLVIFFIPRIVTADKQDPDHNKQIITAFFASTIIFLVTSFVTSVIKVLIDLPLGLV